MRVIAHLLLWEVGLAKAETQTTDAERECLVRHAASRRCLVETGSGRCHDGPLAPHDVARGVLYGVDPYPKGRLGFNAQRLIARHEVGKESNGSMRWVRAMSVEARARTRLPVPSPLISFH